MFYVYLTGVIVGAVLFGLGMGHYLAVSNSYFHLGFAGVGAFTCLINCVGLKKSATV